MMKMICKRAALVLVVLVVCTKTTLANVLPDDEESSDSEEDDYSESDEIFDPSTHKTVNLTIFYEALDLSSINFFVYQLKPTYQNLRQRMIVELVPYGRAQTTFSRGIVCEHGRNECALNKVMACAFEMLQSQEDKVVYSTCVLQHGVKILHKNCKCAQRVGLSWGRVNNCATGSQGDNLLQEMGKKTPEYINTSRLPMIQINGVYDPQDEQEMLSHFEKFICKYLDYPPGCDFWAKEETNEE